MTKTHLIDVVKLDYGTFAQWRTVIRSILIKEGEWWPRSGSWCVALAHFDRDYDRDKKISGHFELILLAACAQRINTKKSANILSLPLSEHIIPV